MRKLVTLFNGMCDNAVGQSRRTLRTVRTFSLRSLNLRYNLAEFCFYGCHIGEGTQYFLLDDAILIN